MITLTGIGNVTFRNPDMASKYNLDTGTIIRYTRGQKIITYRDTTWRSIETEALAFKSITETKKDEISGFFTDNLGREINITKPHTGDCDDVAHIFTGYIYSDIIDWTITGSNGCQQLYEFGLVLLYKIGAVDLKFLLTQDDQQLITEAGEKLKIEAD